jgi:hypothetical protein
MRTLEAINYDGTITGRTTHLNPHFADSEPQVDTMRPPLSLDFTALELRVLAWTSDQVEVTNDQPMSNAEMWTQALKHQALGELIPTLLLTRLNRNGISTNHFE